MSATKIMLIRHAEKPDDIGGPVGVTAAGETDKESLIVQGWQRAGALAVFLTQADADLAALGLAKPDAIFASDDHKHAETASDAGMSKEGSHSKRPQETVTPLGAKLGLKLDNSHWLGDEAALVDERDEGHRRGSDLLAASGDSENREPADPAAKSDSEGLADSAKVARRPIRRGVGVRPWFGGNMDVLAGAAEPAGR